MNWSLHTVRTPRAMLAMVATGCLLVAPLMSSTGEGGSPFFLQFSQACGLLVAGLLLIHTRMPERLGTLPLPGAGMTSCIALLGLTALFAVSQDGISTPLDSFHRDFLGMPAIILLGTLGFSLLQRLEKDTNPTRFLMLGSAFLLLGFLFTPHYPDATPRIPGFALFNGGPADVWAGTVMVGTAALGTINLIRPLSRVLIRITGLLAFFFPALWLFFTHAPFPTVALAVGLLLGFAHALHRVLSHHDPPPNPTHWGTALEWTALAGIFGLFILLKTHGLRASATDENIYFYDAWSMTQGALPYRDFFFAHPPLHLLFPTAWIGAFGFGVISIKLLAPIATLTTGAFVHRIAREQIGVLAGILAPLLFLFANETLKASTNLTGVNLTGMFIAGGLWAVLRRQERLGGALFALAASTGFYAMAGVMAVGVLLPFRSRQAFLRFTLVFCLIFGGIALVSWAIGGEAYLDQVYRYHGLKPDKFDRIPVLGPDGGGISALFHNVFVLFYGSREFLRNVYYHGGFFWLGALSPVVVAICAWGHGGLRNLRERLSPTNLWDGTGAGTALLCWLVALAYFVQLSMFKELYDYYITLPFSALAVTGAWATIRCGELIAGSVQLERSQRPPVKVGVAVTLLMAVTCLAIGPLRAQAYQTAFPAEIRQSGEEVHYTYLDPPVLPSFSPVVRTLFWRGTRARGALQPGYAHYLWSKQPHFSSAEAIAKRIEESTSPEDTLAGASTMAPLIALLANRRIAAGEVDTNTKRFRTGLLDWETYSTRICRDRVSWLIGTKRSYFSQRNLERRPLISEHFVGEYTIRDEALMHHGARSIQIYRRTTDPAIDCR